MARAPRSIKVPGETVAASADATDATEGAAGSAATLEEAVVALTTRQPLAETVPDAADIDPKTIARPVLTKQGWVCPE